MAISNSYVENNIFIYTTLINYPFAVHVSLMLIQIPVHTSDLSNTEVLILTTFLFCCCQVSIMELQLPSFTVYNPQQVCLYGHIAGRL